MIKKLTVNRKKHWTLRKELKQGIDSLKGLAPTDESYKPTLDAIEQISKLKYENRKTVASIAKDIGTLLVLGFVAVVAYSIDRSDEIPRNKASQGVLKMFRF